MDLDIFTSTKNWNFTQSDLIAEEKFSRLQQQTRSFLPQDFYHKKTLTHKEFMQSTQLYKLLKTIPKAVMHHLHIDCAEDEEFYRLYVATDPNVYLDQERKHFKIGTKKKAEEQKWVSMAQEKLKHKSQQDFVKYISNITMFNTEQLINFSYIQTQMWEKFQQKISNFFELYFALHIFKKYIYHALKKYIHNGYDRIEFRALLCQLTEYDSQGNIVKVHPQDIYLKAFDQSYNQVKKEYPNFTAGIVFFGLKVFSPEDNEALFEKVCELNWDKTLGFDFVQQQDAFGPLQLYDPIIDKVMKKYPHLDYKKVYHAGETKDHLKSNLQVAVKAGSVRIGHGFNILQRIQFLPHCKNICFQKNPLSNVILGYNVDSRQASAPILLGLGYAVTINPDDPGKFGVQDTTVDYFLAAISYNWTLKHLKLIAYHSINHAICDQHTRNVTLKSFNERWNKWVKQYIKTEQHSLQHKWLEPDIYNNTSNWSWNQEEEKVTTKIQNIRSVAIKQLPRGFYQEGCLLHLKKSKQSPFYKLLKTLPKGALHNCHFQYNFDSAFLKAYIINDPNIYFNKTSSQLCYGTKERASLQSWTSLKILQQELNGQDQLLSFINNTVIATPQEISKIQKHSKKVWQLFTNKTSSLLALLKIRHIFKNYCKHVFRKYYSNGYNRVQFRSFLHKLSQYDESGNFVAQLNEDHYTKLIDEAYSQILKDCPSFTIGFIFVGLRSLSDQENKRILTKVCELNWNKTIAFDFIEESSKGYDNIEKYNKLVDEVLTQFDHLHYKKCYHAGDTRDHFDKNIEDAVMLGSARIGNGINIIQRIQFLHHCQNVCFQLNPISNSIASYSARSDLRLSIAPILLGLGYSVSINPDFPAVFGFQDTTQDYFVSCVSFNWTLKHLKLIATHSINHAICTQGTRIKLSKSFQTRWNEWINNSI